VADFERKQHVPEVEFRTKRNGTADAQNGIWSSLEKAYDYLESKYNSVFGSAGSSVLEYVSEHYYYFPHPCEPPPPPYPYHEPPYLPDGDPYTYSGYA